MPIYEYECSVCGVTTEVIQSMDADPPVCETDNVPLKKILSVTNVRRGAGLYSVDTPSVANFDDVE